MPACSTNVNVCGEYFVQALLPYLRVHERFRWGQLNQLARSIVYTPLYEEKAMVESLRLSLGHLDADPQNLMHTVPPECGTNDASRLWWLGQKLTNWHMYGARFNHLATKRAARARAYEVQRLKSLYREEHEQECTRAGTKMQQGGAMFRQNIPIADFKREHSYSCEEDGIIGDPVLNDLAMRFTYYDTMKCRRRWDPEDRSLAPCTSSMDCDFDSLNDRILPLHDDHVCLNLTVLPFLRQQASVEGSSSAASRVNSPLGPPLVDVSDATLGAESSNVPEIVEGFRIDDRRIQSCSTSPVRGTVRISSPSSSSPFANVNAAPYVTESHLNQPKAAHQLVPNSNTTHANFRKYIRNGISTIDGDRSRADSTSSCCSDSTNSFCSHSGDDEQSWGSTAASTPRKSPTGESYIRCMVQPDHSSASTRLGNTFKQLGEYLNSKNYYHDDIFVPFVIKALLSNPHWAHELVHKGYPMEVLFWAWSVCSDATLFNGVKQLPAPVRYRFPGHPSLLLASTGAVPPPSPLPLSPLSLARQLQYAPSRTNRHKDRYGTANRIPNSANHPQKSSRQFQFQYNSSLGGFDPAKLISNHRRKPWEFHPWNVASITDYINPEEENQLKLDRKLCVQAHSYLCCSLLFDIQSRIHKLYGGNRQASSRLSTAAPNNGIYDSCGKVDIVISCFWDPSAHTRLKAVKFEKTNHTSLNNLRSRQRSQLAF